MADDVTTTEDPQTTTNNDGGGRDDQSRVVDGGGTSSTTGKDQGGDWEQRFAALEARNAELAKTNEELRGAAEHHKKDAKKNREKYSEVAKYFRELAGEQVDDDATQDLTQKEVIEAAQAGIKGLREEFNAERRQNLRLRAEADLRALSREQGVPEEYFGTLLELFHTSAGDPDPTEGYERNIEEILQQVLERHPMLKGEPRKDEDDEEAKAQQERDWLRRGLGPKNGADNLGAKPRGAPATGPGKGSTTPKTEPRNMEERHDLFGRELAKLRSGRR